MENNTEQYEHCFVGSIETANAHGLQGWEAVGFYYYGGYTILMKRKIPKQESKPISIDPESIIGTA